jgi:tetratricopeptide (TPR) repeat protein
MKVCTIHIAFFVIVLCVPTRVFSQAIPDHEYIKALGFIETRELDSALFYLDRSSLNAKSGSEFFLEKGKIMYYKSEFKRAIDEFSKAEKAEQGKVSIWIAKCYARLGDLDRSLAALETNLNSTYKQPESRIMLDRDFEPYENDPRWIRFWKEGNWYTAFDNTMAEADFLITTKKYTDAINLLSESLTKGFRKSPVYERRADIYIILKNYPLALSDLNNALQSDGLNPNLHYKRARINYISGNFRQSVEDFSSAIRYQPVMVRLYQDRAMALQQAGFPERAIQDMKIYLSYFPEDDSAWYHFGLIYSDQENYLEAISCLNKSLSFNSSDARYFSARGKAYMNSRTYNYAWRDFAMSLDLDPRNAETYLNKGIVAIYLDNRDDACFCFQTANKLGNNKAISFIEKYCK